jgi:Protein of unknown function (DUF1592)/Protein of unknown function (DUF1588)/Protein of unknown function (DUF1595)/Protein of unknown function (DUF1587)/Protein of unknown function (DUF1585)
MGHRFRWLGIAAGLAACTGDVAAPPGPNRDTRGAEQPQDGSTSGPDGGTLVGGEAPSTLGTGIFAQCSAARETPGPRLLRHLTRREYQHTVRDLLHVRAPDVATLPLETRVRGYDNNAGAQAVTSRHVDAYLELAAALADQALASQRAALVPCNTSDAACARAFVTSFGERAFRRPLREQEITRYTALFDAALTGGSFDVGLRQSIIAMLIAPAFLYRSEVGEARGDGSYGLTPYEVASSLSYLYWGSMPDDALFAAAREGRLASASDRAREAARLLADPRAEEQLFEFSKQWLRTDLLLSANKDKQVYPSFSDELREDMLDEQRAFITQVVLRDRAPARALFDADYVMVSGVLAQFYGLSGQGSAPVRVPAGDSERGGLLGLGAVLAAHAHSSESSPVRRGLFVRDRLLCQDLPPPPQNLDIKPPGLDPTLTTRARFARHTADAACAGCHQWIDGVGFGFEGFDGVGQRRLTENGSAVDESGSVVGLSGLTDPSQTPFSGIRDLSAVLAQDEGTGACLALQFYRYARGYAERPSDACSLAALKQRFDEGDSVYALLLGLSQLDAFVTRRDP